LPRGPATGSSTAAEWARGRGSPCGWPWEEGRCPTGRASGHIGRCARSGADACAGVPTRSGGNLGLQARGVAPRDARTLPRHASGPDAGPPGGLDHERARLCSTVGAAGTVEDDAPSRCGPCRPPAAPPPDSAHAARRERPPRHRAQAPAAAAALVPRCARYRPRRSGARSRLRRAAPRAGRVRRRRPWRVPGVLQRAQYCLLHPSWLPRHRRASSAARPDHLANVARACDLRAALSSNCRSYRTSATE